MVLIANDCAGKVGLPAGAGGGVPLSGDESISTRNVMNVLAPAASATLSVAQPANRSLGMPLRVAAEASNSRPGKVRFSE